MHNVLIAREGYIYTNGETYAYIIRLGINDSPDNWYEMTEEEHNAFVERGGEEERYNV